MPRRSGNAAWFARRLHPDGSAALREDDLDALDAYLIEGELPPGKVLYSPSKPSTRVCIVRRGRIELSAGAGRDRSIVQIARSGDVIGDVYAVLGVAPPFTARTVERTLCLFLEVDSLRRLLMSHPGLANLWVTSLSARIAELHVRMLETLGKTLHERVARLLLQEAEEGVVRLPQASIAAMLSVQRASVNRVLRRLEEDGLVELGYRRIGLKDQARLREVAYPGSYANLVSLL